MRRMPHAPDFTALINGMVRGWDKAMGLVFTSVSPDEVVAEVDVAEHHLQPYGIVHGGVHCGLVEAACSTGAAVYSMQHGQTVVGLENSTSFLRAARAGKLRVRAVPLQRGRRAHVWEAVVSDAAGNALASGRVRLICLEPDAALAGKKVEV